MIFGATRMAVPPAAWSVLLVIVTFKFIIFGFACNA